MEKTIREDMCNIGIMIIYLRLLWIGYCMCIVAGYRAIPMLSENQIDLIRTIFRKGDENLKAETRAIVAHYYTPWVKRFCGDFAQKHRVMGDKVLVDELYQSGYLGFMESLENYDGTVKIPYYSGKYIHGRLCKIMKLRGHLRDCEFVSYAQRWKLESWSLVSGSDENLVSKIKAIMMDAPEEYRQWFFARYDCETLKPRGSVMDVCNRMNCSDETYRRKMKKINQYLREKMNSC